jgi:hypothetical protein
MRRAAQANWSRLPNHNPPRFYTAWVIRVILTVRRSLPVYPDKQTISEPVGTSHLCHKRKNEGRGR